MVGHHGRIVLDRAGNKIFHIRIDIEGHKEAKCTSEFSYEILSRFLSDSL